MSGAGDSDHHVQSWGYKLVDGARWRVWRYRHRGELVAEVILPTFDSIEALVICARIGAGADELAGIAADVTAAVMDNLATMADELGVPRHFIDPPT